eukprot:GHVQ01016289.1.p1 GENE.GHVQ01016289.1~~GHVQ01016289.1.p1  ORF type:complete len:112 (+),score=15.72 GHVQ01016289.1:71-406(+)
MRVKGTWVNAVVGGLTPSYMLTGQDVMLPGWQWCTQPIPAHDRLETLRQDRMLAMARHMLQVEMNETLSGEDIHVGDVVMYELNVYEKGEGGANQKSTFLSGKQTIQGQRE